MNDHFTISIEITARDADDIEYALLRHIASIDATMASVKRRRKKGWTASVKAATLDAYERERRVVSALQMNIARAYANAKAGAK